MSVGTILLIVLILILIGVLPTWGHSRGWGYGPSGILGIVVVVLLVLLLMGRLEGSGAGPCPRVFSYAREQDDVMKHSLQGAGPWNLVRPLPFSQSAEYATVKSCAAFLCGRLRRRLTRRSTSFLCCSQEALF